MQFASLWHRDVMTPSIKIDKVTKKFGSHLAVNNLSLDIPHGSIYGFLGPNGAGKTTTIRMIMSILHPDSGTISILGEPDTLALKDRIGYLPEEKGLYKKMKALDLVTYFGQLKGMNSAMARRRGSKLLNDFGLGDCVNMKCDALSKGMGQKVQIAATIVHEPDIVILDEPFSGLDPINIELVRNTILDMKKSGKCVIFSTHIMEQAEQICDSLMLINKGNKLLEGSLEEIKTDFDQTIRIEYEGNIEHLSQNPLIDRVNDMGKQAEISLTKGADPQNILKNLIENGVTIRQFVLAEPSLHEIFVRAIGSDQQTGSER